MLKNINTVIFASVITVMVLSSGAMSFAETSEIEITESLTLNDSATVEKTTQSKSLRVQLDQGLDINEIQCQNESHVLVLRTNDKLACVYGTTAYEMGWEAIQNTIINTENPTGEWCGTEGLCDFTNTKVIAIDSSSNIEFIDDGREIQRATLQKAPAPWPMFERIMDSQVNPDDIDDDGLVRMPSIAHEKYSVNPGVGFYIEDWMPTHILDGQKLLYAQQEHYDNGNAYLRIEYVPTTFVLNENVTTHDLDVSKGYAISIRYDPVGHEEAEDGIEHLKEVRAQKSGNYGLGFVEMTRDGKTVHAFEGGDDLNHYRANLYYLVNENISVGVLSHYHTIDELLPVFESVGP